jgi:hypothetical protein
VIDVMLTWNTFAGRLLAELVRMANTDGKPDHKLCAQLEEWLKNYQDTPCPPELARLLLPPREGRGRQRKCIPPSPEGRLSDHLCGWMAPALTVFVCCAEIPLHKDYGAYTLLCSLLRKYVPVHTQRVVSNSHRGRDLTMCDVVIDCLSRVRRFDLPKFHFPPGRRFMGIDCNGVSVHVHTTSAQFLPRRKPRAGDKSDGDGDGDGGGDGDGDEEMEQAAPMINMARQVEQRSTVRAHDLPDAARRQTQKLYQEAAARSKAKRKQPEEKKKKEKGSLDKKAKHTSTTATATATSSTCTATTPPSPPIPPSPVLKYEQRQHSQQQQQQQHVPPLQACSVETRRNRKVRKR